MLCSNVVVSTKENGGAGFGSLIIVFLSCENFFKTALVGYRLCDLCCDTYVDTYVGDVLFFLPPLLAFMHRIKFVVILGVFDMLNKKNLFSPILFHLAGMWGFYGMMLRKSVFRMVHIFIFGEPTFAGLKTY